MTIQGTFGRRNARKTAVRAPQRESANERIEVAPLRASGRGRAALLGVVGTFLVLWAIGAGMRAHKAPDTPAQSAAVETSAPARKAPEPCEATMKEYSSLTPGMSLRRAASIIGCAGEEMSRAAIGGQETVMVSWTGNGGFISNMNATFDNDRLVAKAQLGLE
ncbi:MAG: hypothetical protein HY834_20455 [Devosia nanyangense]|uniref:DUF3862 domain-containing protein n=1 Tax=Devosia nanyangense TaxID=1228055 RepID=A0A933L4J9_9HYPH|nr:hypothetical protein [Devosia nanyangense]